MFQRKNKKDHPNEAFDTARGAMADVKGNLTISGRVLWFCVGFFGGLLGMFVSWIVTHSWTPPVRRQAVWIAWAGFAAQVVITMVLLNMGLLPGVPAPGVDGSQGSSEHVSAAFG